MDLSILMKNTNKVDRTVGIPKNSHRRVLQLAIPIILANLTTPILGAVDTAVMGHLASPSYLAAVSIGAIIIQFIFWGFGFLRMGTTGLTAQAFGINDKVELQMNFLRPALFAVIMGFILWILQIPIINFALYLFEASHTVETLASNYFEIRIWSAPAVLINYCLIGWFIGIQKTKITLLLHAWMNIINIILDLVFVIGFEYGIVGVAIATVIAEVSTTMIGIFLFRREIRNLRCKISILDLLNLSKIKKLLENNLNIFIRTFCLIFAFAYFTSVAAKFGSTILAVNAVLFQFIHFLSFGLDGFAQTAETLVGSALSAKNRIAYKLAVKTVTQWSIIIGFLYSIIYYFLGPILIDLLTDLPEVRSLSKEFLIWMIFFPIVAVWPYLLDGIFIGAMRSTDMRNGMLFSLAIFLGSINFLVENYGYNGSWVALYLFMLSRGITLMIKYPQINKNLKVVPISNTD